MKLKKWTLVLAAALPGFFMQQAQAGLVAYWTFPTGYNNSTNYPGTDATPDFATSGWSGTILANNGDGVQFSASLGTTLNDPSDTPDASLRFQDTTTDPSFELQLTRGAGGSLGDFVVTYATRVTKTSGDGLVTWEWSTDGTNFSSAGVVQPASVTYPGSGTNWYVRTADFTGVTDINNIATGDSLWFRATLTSGTTEYFDNIVIQTVPAPGAPVISAPQVVGPGEFGFWVSGSNNVTYTVQVSTNLASANWEDVTSFQLTTNSLFITDPTATNSPRFYRIESADP